MYGSFSENGSFDAARVTSHVILIVNESLTLSISIDSVT